jgi:predicted ABC-type ATPase
LRMFAGPNGSGKSTLKSVLPEELLGVYINPDEIEREVRDSSILDFRSFGVECEPVEIRSFFMNSQLLRNAGLHDLACELTFASSSVGFRTVTVNAYFASVAADLLRQKLLENGVSFSFETVMSSPDKVEILRNARRLGYRTYLYYVATEDPSININRVRLRVAQGGHDVPEDKIVSRYHRSLDLLLPAIRETDRAYIFDNSGENKERVWVAEITGGESIEMKTDRLPAWFQRAVISRIRAV